MNHRLLATASLAAIVITSLLLTSSIKPAYAATVSVPIIINMLAGSGTPESAGTAFTVTCNVNGVNTNYSDDASPAMQAFPCDPLQTVTVTIPTDTSFSRFRFSDDTGAKSFTSCSSGTCPSTTYDNVSHQVFVNVTLSGLDSGRAITVTRTLGPTADGIPYNGSHDYYMHLPGSTTASKVIVPHSSSQWIGQNGTIIVFARVTGTNDQYLLDKFNNSPSGSDASSNRGYLFRINNGKLTFSIGDTTSSNNAVGATSVNDGLWRCLAGRYNGTTIEVLVNGVPDGNTASTKTPSQTTEPLAFGIEGESPSTTFAVKGDMDSVRIYKWKTISQIQDICNGKDDRTNLQGYWKFDEGSGSSTADDTGNSSSGTLSADASFKSKPWANEGTTISFENPDSRSSILRYLPDTPSITATINGTSTVRYYLQNAQLITPSGLDAMRSVSVTRTSAGSSGTTSVAGNTQATVWADENTVVTVSSTVVVTPNQDRFASYNGTALSYNATTTNTKRYVYDHQFMTTPRIHEAHLGDQFQPMPLSIYTGTFTSSNSTQTAISFNQQVADDYMQPSSAYWFRNGTTSWSNITWRSIIANATGSSSITSSGNFDIQSAVKHYGILPGNYHFRYGVDSGTTSTMTFDNLNAKITFNGTASSGTHSVAVEFLPQLYSGVRSITINGSEVPIANYTVTTDTSLSPIVSVLTINNIHFSTDSIVIVFQAASTSSGSGGGGGGGGGSIPSASITNPPTGSALALSIEPVTITISPGETQTSAFKLTWQGATKIIITNVQFIQHPEWFRLQQALPTAAVLSGVDNSAMTEVPFVVALPDNYSGPGETVEARVTAITGASQVMQSVPVTISASPTNDLALYGGIAMVIVIGVAIALRKRRR